jgi:hypothetical protein
LPEEWKESIIVLIYRKGDKTDCSNYRGISLLLTKYKILSNNLLSRLTQYAEEITGDLQCGYDATDQLLIIYSAFTKYKKKWGQKVAVHQLFIDFKKSYDSVRREVLYNILVKFGIPMKMVRLIKMSDCNV